MQKKRKKLSLILIIIIEITNTKCIVQNFTLSVLKDINILNSYT